MSANTVVLGLGSNLGQPIENLRLALSELKKIKQIEILNVSPIYESDAQVPENAPQDWNKKFLNAAVLVKALSIQPKDLLHSVKLIEKKIGRTSSDVWAPRLIDIDILYWHGLRLEDSLLTLPHPRLEQRPFALLPLLDVFADAEVARPLWSFSWVAEKPFRTAKSTEHFWPKLIGILNLTDDSFSDGGNLNSSEKIKNQIEKLVSDGAAILDFGAESTRPNATVVSANDEIAKLKAGLEVLKALNLKNKVQVSIDSYKPEVMRYCLENFEVDYINDVSGLSHPEMIQLVVDSKKKAFVMHSLSVPAKTDQFISEQVDPTMFLKAWWSAKCNSLNSHGVDNQQIIFDPGIGFGKTKSQNLFILQNLQKFGCDGKIESDILIGHSRKSYQRLFSDRAAEDRDLETALVTAQLNMAYVQYLRIHDIESQKISLRFM